jgi:hypothetical protein
VSSGVLSAPCLGQATNGKNSYSHRNAKLERSTLDLGWALRLICNAVFWKGNLCVFFQGAPARDGVLAA